MKTVQQSMRRNLTQKTTDDRDAKKYQTQLKIRQKPEKHFSLFIISLTQQSHTPSSQIVISFWDNFYIDFTTKKIAKHNSNPCKISHWITALDLCVHCKLKRAHIEFSHTAPLD